MTQARPNSYCLILAGGIGRRLWPTSRKALPKQFIDFFGCGRTLLQQTYDRFARFIPHDHIFISTYSGYVPIVREQLPEVDESRILPEPVQLNTAQAAIWGTWHAVLADADANIISTPSDQLIHDEARFEADMLKGLDYVEQHDEFLAMGIRPTFPNTAYGYIQMGEGVNGGGLYRVKSFSEKPAIEFARLFKDSGEFLWNTGIFLWKGETLNRFLSKVRGRPHQPVSAVARQMVTIAEEVAYVRSTYSETLPRQIDLCILEHSDRVAVMECAFDWADIGCWSELHDVSRQDADGNAVSGGAKVILNGTQRCMIRLPHDMKAVIAGLDNYLVVQEGDMLMICPNDDPDYVRRLITEAQVTL